MKFRFLPSIKKLSSKIKRGTKVQSPNSGKTRKMRPFVLYAAIVLAILLPTIYIVNNRPKESEAGWFNDTWSYRQRIPITNAGSAQTDFQVVFTLDTAALISAGKMQSDCDDIRVVQEDGTVLSSWVQEDISDCNTSSTKIWAKVPAIPTTAMNIYVYYGNSTAASLSDGNNVFMFFDDFNSGFLDNKWDVQASATNSSYTVTGGVVTFTTTSSAGYTWFHTKGTYDEPYWIESYVTSHNGASLSGAVLRMGQSTTTNLNVANYYTNYSADDVSNGYRIVGDTAGAGFVVSSTTSANTSGVWRFSWSANSVQSFYVNDVSTLSGTNATNTIGPTYIYMGNPTNTTFGSDSVSWIMARKYATTAPVIGTLATEEEAPSPLGYWKFDEGSGTTAYDSGRIGTNGTLGATTATPVWQMEDDCINNKCLAFDGTDDYVDTNKDLSWTTSDSFSISVWVNAKTAQNATILAKGLTGTTWEYSLRVSSSGIPLFVYWDGSGSGILTVTSSQAISLNEWNHITVTYDGSNALMYLNGAVVATDPVSGTFVNRANNLTIGRGYYNGGVAGYFPGNIDEVKIYDYARSADEVKSDYVIGAANAGSNAVIGSNDQAYLSDALTAYWKIDEGTGTSITDASGNSLTGTLGLGTSAPSWASGKFGTALTFDGSEDYVLVSDNADLDIVDNQDFTISAWIYKTSNASNHTIIAKKVGTGASSIGYELYTNTSGQVVFLASDNTDQMSLFSSATVSASKWTLVTAVFDDDNTIKIYINGVDAGGTPTGTISDVGTLDNSNGLAIGAETDRQVLFAGSIDDVRLYKRAFAPEEIADLYEWGPGPVGDWSLDENTGLTAIDSVGGFNGTLTNTPTWVPGQYGSALDFNGSTSYVDMGDVLDPGLSSWSTSAWFKTNDSDGNIMSKSKAANLTARWFTILQSGNIISTFDTNGAGTTVSVSTSSAPYLDDKWHHVETTYDRRGNMVMYIDGALVGSSSMSAYSAVDVNTTCSLFIGRYNDSTNCNAPFAASIHLDGSIDGVKIYHYARTQKQIIADMNANHPAVGSPIGSPTLHFKFDEGYGTTTYNSGNAGSAINGTMGVGSSAPSWSNDGKLGKTLTFDGSNDYVAAPDNAAVDLTSGITVTAWIKTSGSDGTNAYISTKGEDSYYFALGPTGTTANKLSFYVNGVSSSWLQGTSNLNDNAWHYVAGTWDGTVMRLFVDGKLEATSNVTGTIATGSTTVSVGRRAGAGTFFTGNIDELKLYSYGLSPDEINVDMNQGKSTVFGSTGTTSAGVADNSSSREYCVPGDSSTCNSPAGEWKLDENTGTSAYDTSTNGFTGTLGVGSSAPTWASGIVGSAASFDGSDVITLGDVGDTTTEVTLEAWVKPDDVAGVTFRGIVIKRDGGNNTTNWAFRQSIAGFAGADELEFYHYNGAFKIWNTTNANMVANEWAYLAVTYDGASDPIVYKNGVVLTGAWNASFVGPAAMVANNFNATIGGTIAGGSEAFKGEIDSVRIYTYIRTPAQIAWDYNKGRPAAHYKMDECEGTTIYNSATTYNGSPAGSNGTLTIGGSGTNTTVGTCPTSGAWFEGSTGKYSSSINFDGTDDRFAFTTTTDILNPSEGSISLWINSDGSQPNPAYAFSNPASGTNSRIYISWGGGTLVSGRLGDATIIGSFDVTHGQWHHLVLTWNGTAGRFYVDGIDRTTTGTFNGNTTFTTPSIVGCQNNSGTQCFDGRIDDVKTFLYTLTPTQVKTEYTSGAVRFE